MDEFIVQLVAKLDTSQVIKDINELNRQLKEQNIKIKPILDINSQKLEIQEFAKHIQSAIKQASNGKLNIDTNQILNTIGQLSKEINNITSKTNKIQFSIDTGTYESKIANLESQFKRLGLSQEEVAKKMASVKSAYQSLTSSGIGQEELIKREQKFNSELTTTSNHLKILKAEMSEFVSSTKQVNLTNKIEKWLVNNTRATKEARQALKLYLNELNSGQLTKGRYAEISNDLTKIDTGMRSIGRLGKSFTNAFAEGMKKFSYWTSSTFVIMKTITEVKQAISTVKELDTALVDLKKTTTMTGSELEQFYYNSNETAKQMGVTTKQIIEQAAAWSRLGFSSEESATKMAKYSSMFRTISPGMDLNSATDGLVSVMKAFGIGLENTDDVVDGIMSKINIIGNTQALNNSDIVEFLTRSSSAMAEANNSLEETIALGTAAVEITRDAPSVGNALKTVSMRIRGRQTLPPYTVMYMLCA